MIVSDKWQDYECLDTGKGEKLERWGKVILRRPDPQIIWDRDKNLEWEKWDGYYHRSNKGGGYWEYKKKIPDSWEVKYQDLVFKVAPTNFKHTGIFPEQAANWDFIRERIRNSGKKEFRCLNLFAYTGCATMAASEAGASEVVHVDASKGMIEWAKENMYLNHLEKNKIRFIIDDVIKFLEREKRRGRIYQGIIMDPPSYGRGPNGEVWRLEDNLQELLDKAYAVLDPDYSFLLVNSYTTGVSPTSLENILKKTFKGAKIDAGEIGLPVTKDKLILPCGIYGRVTKD